MICQLLLHFIFAACDFGFQPAWAQAQDLQDWLSTPLLHTTCDSQSCTLQCICPLAQLRPQLREAPRRRESTRAACSQNNCFKHGPAAEIINIILKIQKVMRTSAVVRGSILVQNSATSAGVEACGLPTCSNMCRTCGAAAFPCSNIQIPIHFHSNPGVTLSPLKLFVPLTLALETSLQHLTGIRPPRLCPPRCVAKKQRFHEHVQMPCFKGVPCGAVPRQPRGRSSEQRMRPDLAGHMVHYGTVVLFNHVPSLLRGDVTLSVLSPSTFASHGIETSPAVQYQNPN